MYISSAVTESAEMATALIPSVKTFMVLFTSVSDPSRLRHGRIYAATYKPFHQTLACTSHGHQHRLLRPPFHSPRHRLVPQHLEDKASIPFNCPHPHPLTLTPHPRYTLNYKGIPHTTKWVDYTNIEPTCKQTGALPTRTRDDGSPLYTLPVIHDPNTGIAVSDSALIATYLEKQYPDTPKLASVPKPLESAFLAAQQSLIFPTLYTFARPKVMEHLNEPNKEYYLRNNFKGTLPVCPVGDVRTAALEKIKADFGLLDAWFTSAGEGEGPFVTGKEVSFLDFCVATPVLCMKKLYGEDSVEWEAFKSMHEGRWESLLQALKPYETYPE